MRIEVVEDQAFARLPANPDVPDLHLSRCSGMMRPR
jgi:hypothetical protein